MEKSRIIASMAILSILLIWCSMEFYFNYPNTQKELSDRSGLLFLQAMEEDRKLMSHKFSVLEKNSTRISDSIITETKSGRRVFRKPLDAKKLSLLENQKWGYQHLITSIYPNHAYTLDSIFRSLLPASARTAVWCITLDKDTIKSQVDSLFYKKAIALKSAVFEWCRIPGTRIELHAFVEYPFTYIIGQMPNTGIFSVIWLISISGILYSPILYKKKKESVPEEVEKPEVITKEYPPAKMKCIQLPDTLSYNRTLKQLVFGEKNIQLAGISVRLFTAFLDSPEHCLDYSFISVHILDRPTRKKTAINKTTNEEETIHYLDSSDKNAIYQAISVLRTKLKDLPLSIDKIGEQYQLIIPTNPISYVQVE